MSNSESSRRDVKKSAAQILDVSVGSEAWVVSEIPTGMVGILVDHHLIAAPVPVRDDVVIVRRHVPIEAPEPKAFPVSSRQHEDVLRSEAAAKASVRPRLIEVV